MNGSVFGADLDDLVRASSSTWQELREARVFITGGTGFIGSWLVASLLCANQVNGLGIHATVLTRDPAAFLAKCPFAADPAIDLLQGDVRDFPWPAGQFTHVVHAATEASAKLNAEAPMAMIDTIVNGTRRVLEFAAVAGVGRFLFVSSGAVYGRQSQQVERVPEECLNGPDPLDPAYAYHEGKRLAEQMCAIQSRAGRVAGVTIARCFAFVGPYLPIDAHFAIGNLIRDGLRGDTLTIRGDGSAVRSYLYASDLARWLWTILVRGISLRPYNVGSGEGISIGALAHRVAAAFSPAPTVRILGVAKPGTVIDRYVPEVSRAGRELGLVQTMGLDEGIARTVAWHRHRLIAGAAAWP